MAGAERNVISLLREQLKTVHEILEGTMADVTPEQAHWTPPGVALPIGATYAHVIVSEDGVVNGMFRGGAPLFAAAWAGKTGLSELPPPFDPKKPGFPDWSGWSRKVKVDLPVVLAALGLGQSTVGFVINNGILGNAFTHCGEISCLKGLQGKRGYPF